MTFDWLTITPIAGNAGKMILALSVNSENIGFDARQKQFRAVAPDGTVKAILTITQEAPAKEFGPEFNLQQFR